MVLVVGRDGGGCGKRESQPTVKTTLEVSPLSCHLGYGLPGSPLRQESKPPTPCLTPFFSFLSISNYTVCPP